MYKGNIAPGHGELGAAVGSLLIVAQTPVQIPAFKAYAAKLHIGFGKMRRVADGLQQGGFRLHKVAFAQQRQTEVIVMCGALIIALDLALEIGDVLVNIVVTVFHRRCPSFLRRSRYQRQKSSVPRYFSSRFTTPRAHSSAPRA